MRPITVDIDPVDIDADGLADGNSSAGASVTLDGALTSGGTYTAADDLGHQLNITDAGGNDQSTATYTITGTDVNDNALTEDVTGPTSLGTVETTNYFKTVTSVAIASPVATSTVDIGTVDEVEAPTIPVNWRADSGAYVSVDVTGALNFTIQETNVKIQSQDPVWFNITALTSSTASAAGSAVIASTAIRCIFNAYSSGAEAQLYITQAE